MPGPLEPQAKDSQEDFLVIIIVIMILEAEAEALEP